jgi:hypothetical protein
MWIKEKVLSVFGLIGKSLTGGEIMKPIQWLADKQIFVVWDEADMPLGYYNSKEEAEIAFEEYSKELMEDG